MSAPSRLESYFRPLLDSGKIDRSGLLPDDARELLAIAEAQDRVIRYLAEVIQKTQVRMAEPKDLRFGS